MLTIGPVRASAEGLGDSEIALPELRWVVIAPKDDWGTTVQFSGGPFVNASSPNHAVDCRLGIRVLQAARMAEWRIDLGQDETHIERRDRTAVVSASSRDRGSAIIGLRATFVPHPGTPVSAGEYVTQIIGLVTGL